MRNKAGLLGVFLLCIVAGIPSAFAKKYEPEPMAYLTTGGVAEMQFNDNLFRESANRRSDVVALLEPSFRLKTDLKPYELHLRGKVRAAYHSTHAENNYQEADLDLRLGYGTDSGHHFSLQNRYRYQATEIGASSNTPDNQLVEPVRYHRHDNVLRWEFDNAIWLTGLELGHRYYEYFDVERRDGTVNIKQDADRHHFDVTGQLGRYLEEGRLFYVEMNHNQRIYDKHIDSTLLKERDSKGYHFLVGLSSESKKENLAYDIAAGVLHQDYHNAQMADPSSVAFRGNIEWEMSEGWQLELAANRELREATLSGVAGYVQTFIDAELVHQLVPEWSAGLIGQHVINDFQINQFSNRPERTDRYLKLGGFVDYHWQQPYALRLAYHHQQRRSDDARLEYDGNLVTLGLRADY